MKTTRIKTKLQSKKRKSNKLNPLKLAEKELVDYIKKMKSPILEELKSKDLEEFTEPRDWSSARRGSARNAKLKVSGPSKKARLIFIIPDCHFPDHSPIAIELMLSAHRILKPDTTLLLGDVADAGLFSSHPKRSLVESKGYSYIEQEVKPVNVFLDELQKNTKNHTYYLEGNHEQRIERWATNNGHLGEELYNYISPEQTFAAHRNNFTYVKYCKPDGDRHSYVRLIEGNEKVGKSSLVAVHGWSYSSNAAGIHLAKSRSSSIVFGHCHRAESKISRDPWSGMVLKSWCPGTLSKLQALYHVGGTPSDWTWGFSIVYEGEESWTEYSIPISTRGQCVLPNGTEIRLN